MSTPQRGCPQQIPVIIGDGDAGNEMPGSGCAGGKETSGVSPKGWAFPAALRHLTGTSQSPPYPLLKATRSGFKSIRAFPQGLTRPQKAPGRRDVSPLQSQLYGVPEEKAFPSPIRQRTRLRPPLGTRPRWGGDREPGRVLIV